MDGTLIFIFLLDHVPGNLLNNTLEAVQSNYIKDPMLQKCDHTITDPLLQVISRQLDMIFVPQWLTLDEKSNDPIKIGYNDSSYETYVNLNQILENEVPGIGSDSLERQQMAQFEYDLDQSEYDRYHTFTEKVPINSDIPTKGINITERVVAIFESLSNVTAQTCGGTLLTSQWVLTAASCVNLLENMYESSNISTEESTYTIIVNATDPLTDGTAHNVTEIHIHPQPETSLDLGQLNDLESNILSTLQKNLKPDLALMKIEPPVECQELTIDDIELGIDVTVYGWAIFKNDTSHDNMQSTSFPARTLSPPECATHYNITEDVSELCLSTSEVYVPVVREMSWGGPVTRVGVGAVAAVARADGHAPLAAWPLASHARWIYDIIHDIV